MDGDIRWITKRTMVGIMQRSMMCKRKRNLAVQETRMIDMSMKMGEGGGDDWGAEYEWACGEDEGEGCDEEYGCEDEVSDGEDAELEYGAMGGGG